MTLFLKFGNQVSDAGIPQANECAHGSSSALYFILSKAVGNDLSSQVLHERNRLIVYNQPLFKVFIDQRPCITSGIDCHWLKYPPMQEINPIKNKIADLKSRGDALRRYL